MSYTRTKKLTDSAYSSTNASSESAIRLQVDGSIDEVFNFFNPNFDTLNPTVSGMAIAAYNGTNPAMSDIVKLTPLGGNLDDTVQIQNAINGLTNGGRVELTGDFNISNTNGIDLKSNIKLIGRGKARLLGDGYLVSVNRGSGGTTSVADNIKDILIDGIIFEHITKVFSEQVHLLNINAVSNIEVKHCQFIGFKGDGIYIGSSNVSGTERHNENVYIHDCIFDGVAYENRNAITIADCNGLTIENNVFKNCSKSTMPGAIDIEPNVYIFPIIKNIVIKNNRFYNIGGNVGAIVMALSLSQTQLTVPTQNITISDNVIDSTIYTARGFHLSQIQPTPIDGTSLGLNIKVINNTFKSIGERIFGVIGCKGVTIQGNDFYNCIGGSTVGYTGANDKCSNISLIDNNFKKCGTLDGIVINIFTVDHIDLHRNIFDDCGKPDGTYGIDINFGTGISTYVSIKDSTFITPTLKTTRAIIKTAGHTFSSSTNTFQNNNLNGLGNDFVALLLNPIDLYKQSTYDATTLPDTFLLGVSTSIVNSSTGMPTGFSQGVLVTHKLDTTTPYRAFTTQWYYPRGNEGATLTDNYYRRANTATNDWTAWYKVSGVLA